MFHMVLHQMWVHEDELVLLEADEVEGLVWSAAHRSHHYVGPVEDVSNGFHVALLHLRHTDPAWEDD
jgi:hypothetical protein